MARHAAVLATGDAHGKLILVGEHAVIRGFPAVAIPLSTVSATATFRSRRGPFRLITSFGGGDLVSGPESTAGLRACVRATFAALGLDGGDHELVVRASIPIGVGLGSSAAVAVASVRAIFAAAEKAPEFDVLRSLADIAEQHAHGSPSGVDVATVSLDSAICYTRDKGPEPVPLGAPLTLVVADSGIPSRTRDAIQHVRDRAGRFPRGTGFLLAKIGELAGPMRLALAQGSPEMAGRLLNRAQEVLQALGLGIPATNHLVDAARRAGACGAKATGAGLGGSVVAVARGDREAGEIKRALLGAGARHLWIVTMGKGAALCPKSGSGNKIISAGRYR